ncbi:hypothetical protein LCGC14_3164160, partial [marine sediment metagenome]
MISAILLAAGKSRRMGRPKLLMPFGQSTIVEQAIDNLLGSVVDEVIVVLGHGYEEAIKTLVTKPVRLVTNPDYERGMSTSIIAGLNLVDSQAQAVMLALGDQPLITSRTINKLVKEFYNHDKGIALPTCQGRRGHPILFAIKYKEELLELRGDMGGRQIIKDHPDDILEVAVSCEGIFIDIDTADNYHLEKKRLGIDTG